MTKINIKFSVFYVKARKKRKGKFRNFVNYGTAEMSDSLFKIFSSRSEHFKRFN